MKIAPQVRKLLASKNLEEAYRRLDARTAAELRALLAVARAAVGLSNRTTKYTPELDKMVRALARLERVSKESK